MEREIWTVAIEKWLSVGNVGQPRSGRMSERVPSAAGIRLICDALFTDVTPDPAVDPEFGHRFDRRHRASR